MVKFRFNNVHIKCLHSIFWHLESRLYQIWVNKKCFQDCKSSWRFLFVDRISLLVLQPSSFFLNQFFFKPFCGVLSWQSMLTPWEFSPISWCLLKICDLDELLFFATWYFNGVSGTVDSLEHWLKWNVPADNLFFWRTRLNHIVCVPHFLKVNFSLWLRTRALAMKIYHDSLKKQSEITNS